MECAPLKKKSFSLPIETSMIQLLLATQIIDYHISSTECRSVREEEHKKAFKEGISVATHKIVCTS